MEYILFGMKKMTLEDLVAIARQEAGVQLTRASEKWLSAMPGAAKPCGDRPR